MKKLCIVMLGMVLFFPLWSPVHAQEFGRIRALQQRAETVVRQKNSFVARVLASYGIPHQVNEQGVVARIQVDNRWYDITAIEIVPLLKEGNGTPRQVSAHELYFFTAEGVLDLVSELTIR